VQYKPNGVHLNIYEKSRSAHIIQSKVKVSQLLVTQRQALSVAEELYESRVITRSDWFILKKEIRGSSLVEESDVLEKMSDESVGKLEQLKALMEKFVRHHERYEDEDGKIFDDDDDWRD